MPEQNREQKDTQTKKRPKKTLLFVITICLLAGLGLLIWRFIFYKSIDERLLEAQTSLAIPDSENAAFYYKKFFNEPDNIIALEDLSFYYQQLTHTKPWKKSEFPELAAMLEKHKQFIQKFMEIKEYRQTRFQIYSEPLKDLYALGPLIRKIAFVLSMAAANDLAEGRYNEALLKYKCQVQTGIHFQQHPMSLYQLLGTAIEGLGFSNLGSFIINYDITQEQINSIEEILATTRNYSKPGPTIIKEIDKLSRKKEMSLLSFEARVQTWFENRKSKNEEFESYLRTHKRADSYCNATKIFIALKKYKMMNGQWPKNLDEIKTFIGDEFLIDPINGSPYVYKLSGSDFILYSKAENNIDDNGRNNYGGDDWLLWPSQLPQTQAPKTNPVHSDPNME